MMATSVELANEFLKMPGAKGRLTQMHLQKLVYIAHGWSLALRNRGISTDKIEAWDYGPVYPELYEHTKYNGRQPVANLIKPTDGNPFAFFGDKNATEPYCADLSSDDRQIIEHVWRKYGRLSAFKLSDLTHKRGTPWYKAFHERGKRADIDDRDIKKHYERLASEAA